MRPILYSNASSNADSICYAWLVLVFVQLTRDLFAIAKFLFLLYAMHPVVCP